jgi:hypothetical protein
MQVVNDLTNSSHDLTDFSPPEKNVVNSNTDRNFFASNANATFVIDQPPISEPPCDPATPIRPPAVASAHTAAQSLWIQHDGEQSCLVGEASRECRCGTVRVSADAQQRRLPQKFLGTKPERNIFALLCVNNDFQCYQTIV